MTVQVTRFGPFLPHREMLFPASWVDQERPFWHYEIPKVMRFFEAGVRRSRVVRLSGTGLLWAARRSEMTILDISCVPAYVRYAPRGNIW